MNVLTPFRHRARLLRRGAGVAARVLPAGLAALALALPAVARGADARLQAQAGGYVYAVRWSTLPQKDGVEASVYGAWSREAIPRCLTVAGVRELRTFRAAAGEPHILTLFAFDSLQALAAWRTSPRVDSLVAQARQLTYEMATEIWGPSPMLPAPLVAGARTPTPGSRALYVMSWNVAADRGEACERWVRETVPRWAAAPEVLSVCAWRMIAGGHSDVLVFEFASLEAWARWYSAGDVQKARIESRELMVDVHTELWGPNPLLPLPLRPASAR